MKNGLADTERKTLLQRAILMRRFDEAVLDMEDDHGSFGRSIASIGNEAPAAALSLLVKPSDLLCSTHRNHGHVTAMGADPMRCFAEILGKADGLSGGKAGTMHLSDPDRGFLSTSAMVGGVNALAVGAAFAQKRKKNDGIAVSLLGDGTLDEGLTYECLNLAKLLTLPVLFLCENNSKAGEPPSSMLTAKALVDVPKALSIPTLSVDGADAEAIYDALVETIGRIRSGGGPFFIECRLERWPGMRNMSSRVALRHTDLRLAWERGRVGGPFAAWLTNSDPVLKLAGRLIDEGVIDSQSILRIDRDIVEQLAMARARAEASPFPDPRAALEHVFG